MSAVCWCCGGLPSAGVRCLLVLRGVAVCWCPLSAGAAGGCRLLVAAVCWCCGGLPSAGAARGGGVAVSWCLLSAGAVGGCRLLVSAGVCWCCWRVLLRAGASYFLDCEDLCYQLRSQEPRDIRCAGGRFCACFICVVCL